MLRSLCRGPLGVKINLGARLGGSVRPAAIRRHARHLHLECLEPRITLSTMTWTGASSGQWMTAGNWSSDTVPQADDDLVFPAGTTNLNVVNNFPANTQFNTVTIEAPSYSLTGNPINLVSGIAATYSGVSNDAINTDLENGIVGVSAGGTLNLVGTISGSAGLSLSGGGTLGLSGTNNYTGTTVVGSSTLLVRGTIGEVEDSGGVLGGNGSVGNVTSVGGSISPGRAGSPSVLKTGSLSLDANSTFVTELDGNSPGNGVNGYSQVVASGPVALGGATLNATLASGYVPTVGTQYTIVSNTSGSISGTFAGLPEGHRRYLRLFVLSQLHWWVGRECRLTARHSPRLPRSRHRQDHRHMVSRSSSRRTCRVATGLRRDRSPSSTATRRAAAACNSASST